MLSSNIWFQCEGLRHEGKEHLIYIDISLKSTSLCFLIKVEFQLIYLVSLAYFLEFFSPAIFLFCASIS